MHIVGNSRQVDDGIALDLRCIGKTRLRLPLHRGLGGELAVTVPSSDSCTGRNTNPTPCDQTTSPLAARQATIFNWRSASVIAYSMPLRGKGGPRKKCPSSRAFAFADSSATPPSVHTA